MKLPSWWPHKEGDWGQEAIQPVAPSNEYQGQETEKVSMPKDELNVFNVEEWQKTFQEGWRQMIKQTLQELSREERDLEKEKLLGRIEALTKRIDNLETQFAGLYDSCCDLMGRIKSLENQMLWNRPVEAIGRAVRSERDANDAGPTAGIKIHMFGDEVELEEQLRNGKKRISQYAMKELKQRLKKK